MNIKNYKFRCSELGEIISKSGKTTQTMLSHLTRVYIEQTEGIRKEITSKYFEKGVFQEEDGITMLQNTLHPDLKSKSHPVARARTTGTGQCGWSTHAQRRNCRP